MTRQWIPNTGTTLLYLSVACILSFPNNTARQGTGEVCSNGMQGLCSILRCHGYLKTCNEVPWHLKTCCCEAQGMVPHSTAHLPHGMVPHCTHHPNCSSVTAMKPCSPTLEPQPPCLAYEPQPPCLAYEPQPPSVAYEALV